LIWRNIFIPGQYPVTITKGGRKLSPFLLGRPCPVLVFFCAAGDAAKSYMAGKYFHDTTGTPASGASAAEKNVERAVKFGYFRIHAAAMECRLQRKQQTMQPSFCCGMLHE